MSRSDLETQTKEQYQKAKLQVHPLYKDTYNNPNKVLVNGTHSV
jgi:hypothetical protein